MRLFLLESEASTGQTGKQTDKTRNAAYYKTAVVCRIINSLTYAFTLKQKKE